MKRSTTALSIVALLVVSLGLIVAVSADGEAAVDPANLGEPNAMETFAATEDDGRLQDAKPVTDTDDLGPLDDNGIDGPTEDGNNGEYDGDLETAPEDEPEFGPPEDFDANEAANDEDMVIDEEVPEEKGDDDDEDEDEDEDVEPVLYDADYGLPDSDDAEERELLDKEPDNVEASFALDGAEGGAPHRVGRHHRDHDHHHHHREFRCHPVHIALVVLAAVAIGLAGRRLRRQRRAAYQFVPQPPTNSVGTEVPVIVVMGKVKEDDDDVCHGNDISLQGRMPSNSCTAAV